MSRAAKAPAASSRSTTYTRAPAAANASAEPLPMPDAPPVTTTTCPEKSKVVRPMRGSYHSFPAPFCRDGGVNPPPRAPRSPAAQEERGGHRDADGDDHRANHARSQAACHARAEQRADDLTHRQHERVRPHDPPPQDEVGGRHAVDPHAVHVPQGDHAMD